MATSNDASPSRVHFHRRPMQVEHLIDRFLDAACDASRRAIPELLRHMQDEKRFDTRWTDEERCRRMVVGRTAVQAVIAFYTPSCTGAAPARESGFPRGRVGLTICGRQNAAE